MKDRNPAADLPAEPKCYVKVVSLLLYFFFLGSATTHAFIKHVCSLTLLSKLNSYGIRGNALRWITAFLRDRKQRVVLNGFKSSWTNVLSGVPQGSVLGPLLFLVYINDLPDCIENSSVKIFADDLKLYRKSLGSNQPVQDDINRIEIWSSQWQLP